MYHTIGSVAAQSTGQSASVQYGEAKKDQKNDENTHQDNCDIVGTTRCCALHLC